MATFDDVRRIGTAFPDVEESTSYGTPSLKVKKKSFCRMWSDREYARDGIDPDDTEVLVVMCDVEEKPALLDEFDVLFSTPHYDGYGAMLVRLADVSDVDLADFLEDAYRQKAPAKLIAILDQASSD
ncbi:MmcQ/YjbR family DNA-binding protein [Ilumatobacter nonamiensis]|uniref:MmcQ/YjbR family DNA-binding protein n=1 Tax=Ilumatobacter nonamiensis TaxID=467093 RepID=UPI00034C5EA4|nr:MmcQ/YjbR family DNA-binding protein [Ilumatobacter nonamiensis]